MSSSTSPAPPLPSWIGAIVDSSRDAILNEALDGTFTAWNPAAARLFGWTAAEALRLPSTAIVPLEHRAEHQALLERVQRGEQVQIGEAVRRAKDGTEVRVCLTVSPIFDTAGHVVGASTIARGSDARERIDEELRASERIYRGIGESINYGVWICDADGRNTYASPSFLELLGITQQECSQFGWGERLHPDDAADTIAAWKQCVQTGTFWEREHRFRGPDGRWLSILARGVPIRDESGAITCWAGVNIDISARVEAEQALRLADRRKDEFLAMLGHELRNPLAPIVNGLRLLRLADAGRDDREPTLQMIERQVSHLVRLVDDLLEISRVTRGVIELQKEPIDLASVVASAVETSRPLLEAAAHRLEVQLPEEPLVLDGDPVRLAQVLSNLLSNAATYTDDGGRIRLFARRDGERTIEIGVQDNGIGIPAAMLPRVFDLFARVEHDSKRSPAGLGIGLSLARSLVEMHGGTLEARSAGPGRGSEFLVRLPAPTAPCPSSLAPQRTHGHTAAEASAESRRILVVDDNRDAAESLAALLQVLGHEVEVAYDGASALEKAGLQRPQIVILDLSLPGLHGHEVGRRLRREPGFDDVLIVALTGHGQAEHRKRSQEAGFDAHLLKPVDLSDLEVILRTRKGATEPAEPRS